MINNCNSIAPFTFSWQTVLPSISNSVLEDPAVYLDHDSLQCYIHGGKCDTRGNRHAPKKLSADLIQIDLSRFSITAPAKVENSSEGVGGSFATVENKSNFKEACAVHMLYTDNTLSSCSPVPSETDSRIVSSQSVLCHSHILFRYGTFLALHGGRDDNGVVCNNMLAFHLISRCWEDIKNLYGGDASPRMYGHAVATISAAKGFFLVMGAECNPNGTFIPSRKRTRAESLEMSSSKAVLGRPPNAHRSALSIYTLRLEDRLEGWRKIGVSDVATHGPCARVYFSMDIAHSSFTSACDESSDLTEEPFMVCVAYLAGGKIGSTYLADVWRYDLTTKQWREVVLPQHPACDLTLSSSLGGPFPQRRARAASGRDRRVKPYLVRLVPLIDCSPKGIVPQNTDAGHEKASDMRGKWSVCMSFLLRVPRRKTTKNQSSLPLPSLAALHEMDALKVTPKMRLPPEGASALPIVPIAKSSKLSTALATFLVVDSEETPWLFYLGRDRKLDVFRVQGLS